LSPTPRAALGFVVLAGLALLLPISLVLLAALAWATAMVVDAWSVRARLDVERTVPSILSRGVAAPLLVAVDQSGPGHGQVRQPTPPDLDVEPPVGGPMLEASITATRRGRHTLPGPALRRVGPLGLGRWDRSDVTAAAEVTVYPDLHTARRLAAAVRHGKLADAGLRMRGPLGLGTEFESIRDYQPDDDIRQVNWRATARMQRPMSNIYRVEQDRDVVCVVDTGRLMAAPLGSDRTRLDAALDAVAAVAMVADVVGDRVGVLAFDREVRRHVRPRRHGSDRVVAAVFDLEPNDVESDYELAFRTVGGSKRSLVLVLTDLLEESAAKPLVAAAPVLSRRHAVVVAGSIDPDLDALLSTRPALPIDAYSAAVAVDVLEARHRAAARLKATGVSVLEAAPGALPAACVSAYLRLKARARL
jgi:uncharacterized protein (DUF58 family)